LTPQDLKLGVVDTLNAILEPIRQEFASNKQFQEAFELAYPKPSKKTKKAKDKGSKCPGAQLPGKGPQQAADVLVSECVTQDLIANGPAGNLSISVAKGAADALKKLNVSDTTQ
jgi:hypothetical protein